ncbi:hypothetical protein D9M70_502060 [compost metagenome]
MTSDEAYEGSSSASVGSFPAVGFVLYCSSGSIFIVITTCAGLETMECLEGFGLGWAIRPELDFYPSDSGPSIQKVPAKAVAASPGVSRVRSRVLGESDGEDRLR